MFHPIPGGTDSTKWFVIVKLVLEMLLALIEVFK